MTAFPVYAIYFFEIVNAKWCSDKSIGQTKNGLERGFVKHGLNLVKKKKLGQTFLIKIQRHQAFLTERKEKASSIWGNY